MAVVPYARYASNAVYDAIKHLQLHAQFEDDFTLLPYAFSFPLYAEDASNTMNLAGVGREMTGALSELFLKAYSTSRSAREAFSELNECLEASDPEASLLEFLTLDTLSEAHNSLRFHAGRRLISLEKYSPSQLFFIAACYSTCRGSLARGSHNHCDTALRHLKSFSDAFLCSFETPTGPMKMCSL
ncbi:hypothetical protein HPB49_024164 [Dermacentor silvarum]|uniref:Uncharacterized protein n=1 Tax=Dermacentor silvarum TaxID=543639 RepID=A0ACB8CNH6_DERSI|nr:hypothetical protein HPB49_024164 [Dermacentor silvarum]